MKFSIKKKGYDIVEVDNYIDKAEEVLLAQKERMQKLRSQISTLEAELNTYYEKKDLILAALSEAVKKAEQIEQQAVKKYELEISRLRQFHLKWTEHYGKLVKKNPALTKGTDDFLNDMDRILRQTDWDSEDASASISNEELYIKEKQRLNSESSADPESNSLSQEQLSPLERIKSYLDNGGQIPKGGVISSSKQPEEERVLCMNEALHPKQELADIMKDLGLLED